MLLLRNCGQFQRNLISDLFQTSDNRLKRLEVKSFAKSHKLISAQYGIRGRSPDS